MQLLKYGLKNGELVSIESVENGLSCGCVCPSCGGRLEAHQGQKMQHHFKHYSVSDCEHGSESALHIMAKNIIARTKSVYIPNAPLNIYDFSPKGSGRKFENAHIEKQISPQIRCDVLLETANIKVNVEIKVTHEVDDAKKFNLFNEDLRTIEIDLSDLTEDFSEAKIQKIIESGERTTLIYSPKARDIYAKWWLGEWKKIYRDRAGNKYVKNCRFSKNGQITYFCAMGDAYRKDHTTDECHECFGGSEFPFNDDNRDIFLCRSLYSDLNFNSIEKIIDVKRKNDIVQYAELIVNGELKVFGKRQIQ